MDIIVEESTEFDNCIGKRAADYDIKNPKNVLELLDIEDTAPIDNREWREQWVDMPEFDQERIPFYKKLAINFESEEDYQKFATLIEQKLTVKTRSIWYPQHKPVKTNIMRWIVEE